MARTQSAGQPNGTTDGYNPRNATRLSYVKHTVSHQVYDWVGLFQVTAIVG